MAAVSMTMYQKVAIKELEDQLRGKLIPILPKTTRDDMTTEDYIAFMEELLKVENQTENRDRPPRIRYFCKSKTETCSICLDRIYPMDDVSSYTCEHMLHSHCMVNFLKARNQVYKCCPLCREESIRY